MDTWPLDQVALDSLISSSNALSVSDIDALPDALKGFHAIEYMLFGNGGSRTASQLSARQLTYLQSLSVSLYNVTTALRNSWHPDHGNFTALLTTAGKGSTRFSTRKDAFLAITVAMSGICEEVANNKMETPLIGGPASSPDSSLSESRFSHNSTSDFTNNIKGVLNAYMTSYNGSSGQSLHTLVATTNISLDNKIRSQLNTAISSFSAINSNYEVAIYDQVVQIQNTQNAIRSVQSTIDNELTPFIQANIKD
jgi:predicted lipoprotein